jgi:hypothetical protein
MESLIEQLIERLIERPIEGLSYWAGWKLY